MIKDYLMSDYVETNVEINSWQEAATYNGNILVKQGKVKPEFIQSMIDTVNKYGPYMILVPKVVIRN